MKKRERRRQPMIEVRHSPIHGYGVFALRRIRKGTAVIEYLGDRISHEEADSRYEDRDPTDNHTFLFTVDIRTVIDGGVNGNDARYINHACQPNCQSTTMAKRIFIEAIRTIQPGEELAYDYQIRRDYDDAPDVDMIFACRCGAENCRGSMLEAPRRRGGDKRVAHERTARRRAVTRRAVRRRAAKKSAAKKRAAKRRSAPQASHRGD